MNGDLTFLGEEVAPRLILQFETKYEAKEWEEATKEQIEATIVPKDEVEVVLIPREEQLVNLDPDTIVEEVSEFKHAKRGSHKEEEEGQP